MLFPLQFNAIKEMPLNISCQLSSRLCGVHFENKLCLLYLEGFPFAPQYIDLKRPSSYADIFPNSKDVFTVDVLAPVP